MAKRKSVSDGYSLKLGSSPAGSPYPLGNVLGVVRAHVGHGPLGGGLRKPGEPRKPLPKAAPPRPKAKGDDAPWSDYEPRIGRLNDPPSKKAKKHIA